jgi:hypothetical protein
MVQLALQKLVPLINKGMMEGEIGTNQNLLQLISVVEHTGLDSLGMRNATAVLYEVSR